MNKERLEELKKMRLLYEVCFVDEYASAIDDVTADFDLLIKRVQELEDIIYQDARQGVLEGLYEENKHYRETIRKAIAKFNQDEHRHGMTLLLRVLERSE